MTKILIVDDHPLYREGVMTALRGEPLRALVLGASSAGEALRILDDDPTVDLVLVDLRLGKEDGLEGLRQIGTRHPPIARMLISGHESPGIVRAAMGAGAQGFLSKSLSIGQVVKAINTVLEGGVSWPALSHTVPTAESDRPRAPSRPGLPPSPRPDAPAARGARSAGARHTRTPRLPRTWGSASGRPRRT